MKNIIIFVIITICLLSIVRSIQEIYQLSGKHVLVDRLSAKEANLQKEHTFLEQELRRTSTATFIEEEARNKLFLSKPSEIRVLVSSDTGNKGDIEDMKKPLSNFDQWRLLFHLL